MSKGTILVVDDEPAVRQFVEAVLRREGYSVLEAGDGGEALEVFRIRQEEIDLVLLDLGMPEMSGYEALAEMQVLDPDIHVAIITGLEPDEERLPGIRGILTKPFGPQEALKLVRAILEE